MIDPAAERIALAAEGERQRFLARAGAVLSESLDIRETLRSVAAICVPEVADWVTVTILEDVELRRVAGVHRDPAKQSLVDRYMQRFPPGQHRSDGPLAAIAQGRSIL